MINQVTLVGRIVEKPILRSFENNIRLMCFVWKLAMNLYFNENVNNKINRDYVKENYDTKLIEIMLKGYEIIEGK